MAILANDACGAPLPFQMCLPWTFFDGKLFHAKLRKADSARNLMELCDGRMESVYAIERMRAAILHGLLPQYSNPAAAAGGAAFNAAVAAATNPSAAVNAAVRSKADSGSQSSSTQKTHCSPGCAWNARRACCLNCRSK